MATTIKTVTVKIDATTRKLVEETKKATQSIVSIGKSAASVYAVKAAFDALAIAAAKSLVNTSAQFEQFETVLKTIEGSSQAAKNSMDWITDFTSKTPYQLEQITEAYVKLRSYGINPTNGTLKTLGDTASAMGKPLQQAVEAMADAVVGENERLKEFGIRAAKQGNQIAYSWTDASGKAKHIIVKNNSEIIQSTLEAIFNSKYAGAMEEQSKTFNGIVSNMKDNFTLLQKKLMDAGAFNYLKAVMISVSKVFSKVENEILGNTDKFTSWFTTSLKDLVIGIGKLANAFKGIAIFASTAWNTIEAGFNALIVTIVGGVAIMIDKLNKLPGVNIDNSWSKKVAKNAGEDLKRNLDDINSAFDDLTDYEQIAKDIIAKADKEAVKLKSTVKDIKVETKGVKGAVEGTFNGFKNQNKELEKAKNILKELPKFEKADTSGYLDGLKNINDIIKQNEQDQQEALKALDVLFEKTHTDEEVRLKQLGDELNSLGKYLSQADLAKIYESEIDKMKKPTENLHDWIRNAFDIDSDGMLGKMMDGLNGAFDSITDAMRNSSDKASAYADMDLGIQITDSLKNSGDPTMAAIGYAADYIGAMFSTTLSEQEIQDAAGRNDFKSEFFTTQRDLYEQYNLPQISLAQEQLNVLRDIDASFGSIANELRGELGLKLTGSDYIGSTDTLLSSSALESLDKLIPGSGAIIASLYSKTTELIGSGIEISTQTIEQAMNDLEAYEYQTEKVTTKYLGGLFKRENTDESKQDLSDELSESIQDIISTSIDMTAKNLEVLGFDTEKFEDAINEQIIDIGKIDFKDLTNDEAIEVLQNALGEAIDGAVSGALESFSDPQYLQALEDMSRGGEDFTTTIARVAIGLQEVNSALAFFGQSVDSFVESQELIDAAGGLEAFAAGMDSLIKNFFTEGEQKEYLEMQLQYALAVYDVALPASKEQFKALVLETQQKITTTKANIEAMKAEIAAKVKAGEISLAMAYGEAESKVQYAQMQTYANDYLITSSYNAAMAVVDYGNAVNTSVEAMMTGIGEAAASSVVVLDDGSIEIDYSRITSESIRAAEAELAELEGLYGTLMSQMDSFGSYYNDIKTAEELFDDMTKSLIAIADLKADWGDDPVEAARLTLEATKEVTGLTNLTYENFLDEFNKLTEDGKALDEETLQKWQDMSNALKGMHDAVEELNKELNDFKENAQNAFYGLFDTTVATNVGSLDRAINNEDWNGATEAYNNALENVRLSSLTKEDYFLSAAKLNDKIQRITPENPNQGVEDRLDSINDEIRQLRKEQRMLQGEVVRNTSDPLIVGVA